MNLSTLSRPMGSALSFSAAQILFVSTLQDRTKQAIDAGYTLAQLARAAGTDDAAAAHWKAGRTKTLKAKSALGLAKLTGWSAQWWLDGTGPKLGAQSPSTKSGSSVEYLAEVGAQLSANDLERLIAVGEMLATHGDQLSISLGIVPRVAAPTPERKAVR